MRHYEVEYKLDRKEKSKFFMAGYITVGVIAYLFYMNIWISIIIGFLIIFFEQFYGRYLNKKRREFISLQFKDLLYSLDASISVGRGIEESLKEGENALKIIYKENSPLLIDLKEVNKNIANNHGSEKDCLTKFAMKSGVDDIRNFVEVYLACQETGGNMQEVIGNSIKLIMDKMNIQKEIKTLMTEKQFEAKVVSLIPILIILFLNIFSPDYLSPMYNTSQGKIIMTFAFIGFIFSAIWIEKLMEVNG